MADVNAVADSLRKPSTWAVLGTAAIAGFLGGLVRWGTITEPVEIAWYAYLAIGPLAAIVFLWFVTPIDAVKLIAMSLAVGFAGLTVLDASEARLKELIAKQDVRESAKLGKKAAEMALQQTEKAERLEKALRALATANNLKVPEEFARPLQQEFEARRKELLAIHESLKHLEEKYSRR